MPIYEYECKACSHLFDVLQKISDDPLTYCPECGAPELRKLLSAPNFRLKGGGWYETDFKSDKQRNLADGTAAADKDDKSGKDDKANRAGKDDKAAARDAGKSADGAKKSGGDTGGGAAKAATD